MRDDDLLRLTTSNVAPSTVVIQQPAEPWLKTSLKKIIWGLCLTGTVSIIANQGGFKWAAVQVARIVLWTERHPKPPKTVEDASGIFKEEVAKVRDKVPIGGSIRIGKPQEQLEFEARQREEKRLREEESERNELYAHADAIKFPYEKTWPLEKLRIEVRNAEQAIRDAEKKAAYERERRPLLAEAKELDLVVTDDIDTGDIKKLIKEERDFRQRDLDYQKALNAVEKAEDAYQWNREHGPNACCPRCKIQFRARPENKNQHRICSKCHLNFPLRQAFACYVPPPPPKKPAPPKRNPGLLHRLKKGLLG